MDRAAHHRRGRSHLAAPRIQPISLTHGVCRLSFRRLRVIYGHQSHSHPAWPLLAGVKTVILDALRHRPHPTHFTVSEALAAVERLRPQRTYLTHICHDLPHVATNQVLPAGVGLRL